VQPLLGDAADIPSNKFCGVSMVYFIQEKSEAGYVKIGKTNWSAEERLYALQVGNPYQLVVLATIPDASDDRPYHKKFQDFRVLGEWFSPAIDLMDFISGLIKAEQSRLLKLLSPVKPVRVAPTAQEQPSAPSILTPKDARLTDDVIAKRAEVNAQTLAEMYAEIASMPRAPEPPRDPITGQFVAYRDAAQLQEVGCATN
jgi:hypothetical protein